MTRPLVFEAPRRGKPPRHLADLDPQQRRAALSELGLPAYRADQLSRHYFTRLVDEPGAMTDLPAADPGTRAAIGEIQANEQLNQPRSRLAGLGIFLAIHRAGEPVIQLDAMVEFQFARLILPQQSVVRIISTEPCDCSRQICTGIRCVD